MTEPSAPSEDAAAYIARIRAEIEADAERRRRQEPEIQRREREIERLLETLHAMMELLGGRFGGREGPRFVPFRPHRYIGE